jgi:hypothetical protein
MCLVSGERAWREGPHMPTVRAPDGEGKKAMNKIHGEHTRPTNEPPLCHTCSNATIVRGTRFGDDVIRCHALGRVKFHVTDCTSYSDSRLVPVYRLEETAWRWFGDRFVSPAELLRLRAAAVTPNDDD